MAILGKIELGDRDRLLLHRFTEAINKLADELHTYNNPPVEVAEAKSGKVWAVPPEAGDYIICGDLIRHRYSKGEDWHDHPTHTSLRECVDSRIFSEDRDIDPTDKESPS